MYICKMQQKINFQKMSLDRIASAACDAGITEEMDSYLMSDQTNIAHQIAISADEQEFHSLMSEASLLLRNTSDGALEAFNAVFNTLYATGKLVCIDIDRATTNARELRVLFKPTDSLRNLVATLRAGYFEYLSIEINRHRNNHGC